MTYQDQWVNGSMESKGTRICAPRYEIIKRFCEGYKKPFSVCDIGANMCYFGLRLIEDFDCVVMAFEYNSVDLRQRIVKKNNATKLMLINRKLALEDMDLLNRTSHFDLVLALSVLHHLPGSCKAWVEEMKRLGDNVIIEYATTDSKRVGRCIDYELPSDPVILGYGNSHIDNSVDRPIILVQ